MYKISGLEILDLQEYVESVVKRPEAFANLQEGMIVLCNDFTPLETIAKAVQRDIRYLNNFIIPRMIQEKKLERLFGVKNHPNQQYKAKQN